MKEKIIAELKKLINLKEKQINDLIEVPSSSELGDYAFPCFALVEELKKNPAEIAKYLAGKIKISKEIERIESKGPYVNFFIDKKILAEQTITAILKEKKNYGSIKKNKERIMVEFSQANTHKAFHIGHVRGTSLGESISRILAFSNNRITRANYQGDTGMHVAKWIWCYKKYHTKEKLKEDEKWIAEIYVEAIKKINENPELQKEVDEINKELELKKDKNLLELWKKTRKLSLNVFENIYKELNTKFDRYFFESEMEKRGKEISEELIKKQIAEISDGAVIINLEKFNLGIWVLLRKDRTVLYSAKDLALAEEKFRKYKIDKSIYVVGSAQKHHFSQLFKTLELMDFKNSNKCLFIPVTEVRLPEGRMSSRTGESILYSEFRKELIDYAESKIRERHNISEKDLNKRAIAIAIASLKYAMLKQDVNKAIVFDKKEALQFEGNTGPYLLYTYARARSILRKANYNKKKYKIDEINEEEKRLIIKLAKFSEIVFQAYKQLAPDVIANYVYKLAQAFNEFYHKEKVIGSENEQFKLLLVDSISQVLKNSLYLLGIETLEQM